MYWMRKRLRYLAGAVAAVGLAFWTLALLGPCCHALADAQGDTEAGAPGLHHGQHPASATALNPTPCPMVLAALESVPDLEGVAPSEPWRLPMAAAPKPLHIADVAGMLSVNRAPSRSPPVPALPRYLSTLRLRV